MVILVTGKSGSGKTYIANNIAPFFNAEVISLDKISHQVLNQQSIKYEIKSYFGDCVFNNNFEIDRKKLGEIVFADKTKLEFLNNLVQTKIENIIDESLNNKDKNFILDYALLPKMKYFNSKNCKILVKTSKNIRKKRVLLRDNISNEYFESRDLNSLEYDESSFDLIIENNDKLNFETIAKNIKEILC